MKSTETRKNKIFLEKLSTGSSATQQNSSPSGEGPESGI